MIRRERVEWTSSAPAVAPISIAGLASGDDEGSSEVSATCVPTRLTKTVCWAIPQTSRLTVRSRSLYLLDRSIRDHALRSPGVPGLFC